MALTKQITFNGVVIPNAYLKIDNLSIDNSKKIASGSISIYATQEQQQAFAQNLYHLSLPISEGNTLDALYNKAKSLGLEANAIEEDKRTKEQNLQYALFFNAIDC